MSGGGRTRTAGTMGFFDGFEGLSGSAFGDRLREKLHSMQDSGATALQRDITLLRELCGPMEPETEKHLATLTLQQQRGFLKVMFYCSALITMQARDGGGHKIH